MTRVRSIAARPGLRGAPRCWVLALALIGALATTVCSAAPRDSDIETGIKAAFIYNFARFVEWPTRSASGPVRVAILGRGDLASPLAEVIRGKTANGRPIEIIHIGLPAETDCCEILLIERSESKRVREIALALADKPILTVCDEGYGFREGAMIVFQMVDESVRFRINQEAAARAGLKISSQLLKVAIPAEGKHI